MKTTLLLLLMAAIGSLHITQAQVCNHTNLSNKYNYKITLTKNWDSGGSSELDMSKILVCIYDKHSGNLIQEIKNITIFPVRDSYSNCDQVRSYITGLNKNAKALKNDYGDFIVADFNFDGKEDFALKYNANYKSSGPLYAFYIQQADGSFKNNQFLTGKVGTFPAIIDSKQKTLTIDLPAKVKGVSKSTYQYNSVTKKWKKKKPVH